MTTFTMTFERSLATCALMAILFSGCGGERGPERVVVVGTVAYDGRPVAEGTIRFTPVQGVSAPTAGAPITDGRYKVESHGGVAVGTYKVRIEAYRKVKNKLVLAPGEPIPRFYSDMVSEQCLPEKYHANTNLEITIPSGAGKITKDFDLAK